MEVEKVSLEVYRIVAVTMEPKKIVGDVEIKGSFVYLF